MEGFISIQQISELLLPGEELGIGIDSGIGKAYYGVNAEGKARELDITGIAAE